MSYYRACPHCGAHLDPGEVCDCQIGAALLLTEGAAERWRDENAAPDGANIRGGGPKDKKQLSTPAV